MVFFDLMQGSDQKEPIKLALTGYINRGWVEFGLNKQKVRTGKW